MWPVRGVGGGSCVLPIRPAETSCYVLSCSGQIGFMICTKASGDGSAALDARVPRQPLPATPEGFPLLR